MAAAQPARERPVREAVRLRVELAVGDGASLEAHERRLGPAPRLALEQIGGGKAAARTRAHEVGEHAQRAAEDAEVRSST